MDVGGMRDLTGLLRGISENIFTKIDIGETSAEDVKKQVEELRNIYKNYLNLKEGDENYRRPEFNNLVTQLAYTFSYYVRHVHVLRDSLRTSIDAINDAEKRRHILDTLGSTKSLCAIGGGPNTDSVGLRLFLRDNGLPFPDKVYVLDKFVEWGITWTSLQKTIPEECRHEARYIQFDLLADGAIATDGPNPLSVIREADLITMIKSLSDVDSDTDRATQRVRQILAEMKTGALLLFIDNKYCQWKEVFDGARYLVTHETLVFDDDVQVEDLSMIAIESDDLRRLCDAIGNYPLLRANESKNVMMLIKKK